MRDNRSQPSILVITTDQQRADSLSCYGSGFTSTPNVDRLAEQGLLFERAYCANPVCTPARASLFSGQYLTRHGAWNVGTSVPADTIMLSHRLAAMGYRTHYVGKAHFQPHGGDAADSMESLRNWQQRYPAFRGPFYGFDSVELALGHTDYGLAGHYGVWVRERVPATRLRALNRSDLLSDHDFHGTAVDWHLPVRLHNSVWTAERTIEFLSHHDPARPFFLAVGFQDPHHPHCVPLDFEDRVRPEDVPLPRFSQGELADKPPHFLPAREGRLEGSPFRGAFKVAGQGSGADFRGVSEHDARLGRAYYYTMVRLIDRETGRILEALDRLGLAENTLVVFTTDHGELLGDHGLWLKGPFHYEELIRIPFVVRWPAGLPGGTRMEGLFSQVDLTPTVLGLIGQTVPPGIDGTDCSAMLRGEKASTRDAAVIECVDDPHGLRLKTVVTRDRKLTVYHGRPFGELYDLASDPGEMTNHWADPTYAGDRQALIARLLDHMEPLERRVPRTSYA
ncbi:sulfatase-like hydrolase/transferase [Verrucomicrobiota bacterium]